MFSQFSRQSKTNHCKAHLRFTPLQQTVPSHVQWLKLALLCLESDGDFRKLSDNDSETMAIHALLGIFADYRCLNNVWRSFVSESPRSTSSRKLLRCWNKREFIKKSQKLIVRLVGSVSKFLSTVTHVMVLLSVVTSVAFTASFEHFDHRALISNIFLGGSLSLFFAFRRVDVGAKRS